jgi:hypothetical protein
MPATALPNGRLPQSAGRPTPKRSQGEAGKQVELIEKEVVRIHDFNIECLGRGRWKVSKIKRHEQLRISSDCSREDVTVFRIAQHAGNEVLVSVDHRIRKSALHCGQTTIHGILRKTAHEVFSKLCHDIGRPQRPERSAFR